MEIPRLRRRSSQRLDPLEIYSPNHAGREISMLSHIVGPHELAVRVRADGQYEALDNDALMRLFTANSRLTLVAELAEITFDEVDGMQVPRLKADGGYVFL